MGCKPPTIEAFPSGLLCWGAQKPHYWRRAGRWYRLSYGVIRAMGSRLLTRNGRFI